MLSWTKQFFPRKGTIVCAGAVFLLSACAVIFPDRTAPKSASYNVTPPPAPWQKVAVGEATAATDSLKADLAYENPETGAIISLNSLCRKYNNATLESLTKNLVRGIHNKKLLSQNPVSVNNASGQDSFFEGMVDGVKINLRTVVLKKDYCTYDFIYVVIPDRERNDRKDFDRFVASFQAEE